MCGLPTQVRPYWINNAKPLVSTVGSNKSHLLLGFNPEVNLVFTHRCSRITYGGRGKTLFPHCVGCVWRLRLRSNQAITWLPINSFCKASGFIKLCWLVVWTPVRTVSTNGCPAENTQF